MFKDIFKPGEYPNFLDTVDALKLSALPPWEFLYDNYRVWKEDFDHAGLYNFVPFSRMINDDVIATFASKSPNKAIYLFNVPLTRTSKPFREFQDINSWLKVALDDCYEYLTEY